MCLFLVVLSTQLTVGFFKNNKNRLLLESILLIQVLAQSFLDPMQNIGALEAAASPITTDHDGTEAAHQYRIPVQYKPLGHHLATRCPIAAQQTSVQCNAS